VAKPELTIRVATFFSDQKTLVELCQQLVREGGHRPSVGLIFLQESLNNTGLLMSPTIYDRAIAKKYGPDPLRHFPARGKNRLERAALTIANQMWPMSEHEMALRRRVAELAGITPELAAWELFALRDHAFEWARRAELGDKPEESAALEDEVYEWIKRIAGPGYWFPDVNQWFQSRVQLYAEAVPKTPMPVTAWGAEWLARVRAAFQEALKTDKPALATIAGVEFDRALVEYQELCQLYASGDP
jgi:hypothetical protein